MLHWYSKVTVILREKNAKETIIVRLREYYLLKHLY